MSDTISNTSESRDSLDDLEFNMLYPDSRSSSVCDDYNINDIKPDNSYIYKEEIKTRKRDINFNDNMTLTDEPKQFTPTPSKHYIMLQENYILINKLKNVIDDVSQDT
jgi:hypothetical protein